MKQEPVFDGEDFYYYSEHDTKELEDFTGQKPVDMYYSADLWCGLEFSSTDTFSTIIKIKVDETEDRLGIRLGLDEVAYLTFADLDQNWKICKHIDQDKEFLKVSKAPWKYDKTFLKIHKFPGFSVNFPNVDLCGISAGKGRTDIDFSALESFLGCSPTVKTSEEVIYETQYKACTKLELKILPTKNECVIKIYSSQSPYEVVYARFSRTSS